ncbi:MAG: glycerophosphodiester phosphodiesterase [Turneriella sp.]
MKTNKLLIVFSLAVFTRCAVLTDDEPEFGGSGLVKNSRVFPAAVLNKIKGNYAATSSASTFRGRITVSVANSRISMFSYDAETYAVFNVNCVDNAVIFEGRTRDPASQTTGLARLRIEANAGGTEICADTPPANNPRITGVYGQNRDTLNNTIILDYVGPLKPINNFYIIGHHGCRTVDNCGASENSLESIKFAGYLGSNAVELDVHMTKDGVPFLYHDDDFNSRLVNSILCLGNVSNYTILLVKVFCRLKYGERIPTLREALEDLLTDDTITLVWLDPKSTAALGPMVSLANEYQTKAAGLGKTLEILIGVPDEDYLAAYKASPGYQSTKCLIEYSVSVAQELGCRAYGPRFTLGPQPADADTMRANGNMIFYWTVNDKSFFSTYIGYGKANGMISDRTFLIYSLFQQ